MPFYRPRLQAPLEALLWLGDNFAAAEDYFSHHPFSVEETSDAAETLTVVDSSGSTRWFVHPGTYVFVKGNMLRTVPREKFEDLYEEVS